MEHIKLIQTQTLSLASSVAGESPDSPASVSAAIDEWVNVDEVLGVWREHRKGVGSIVKGKKNAPNTSYSIVASRSA